jgi:hypothetical protein
MTNREIEKRISALENISAPEAAPHLFLMFRSSPLPADAWEHRESGNTFFRSPGESDDELMNRIKNALNPPSGTVTKLFQRQLERYSD